MTKKGAKKIKHKKSVHTLKKCSVDKILIEKFVSIQKVIINLSVKFDNLSNQISKLLNLFEISAKTLAQKEFNTEGDKKENKKIIGKMDKLLEQNKTIARGLTLMHEIKSSPGSPGQLPLQQTPRPNEYQKSILNPKPNPNERIRKFGNNQNA